MKKIDTLHDHLLDCSYDLYRMNARDIVTRIRKQYDLPAAFIHSFNSDLRLGQHLRKQKGSANERQADSFATKHIQTAHERIASGQYLSKSGSIGVLMGYETMPLAIIANGNVEDQATEIELLDGFKRTFCTEETPDVDILVKVYPPLDTRLWLNSMIVYNSWKFASEKGSEAYLDRGFQLGLYHRFGIDVNDLLHNESGIYGHVDMYTIGRYFAGYGTTFSVYSYDVYETLWDNDRFPEDLLTISAIVHTQPDIVIPSKKGNKCLTHDDQNYSKWALRRMREIYLSTLGNIRRMEKEQGITERTFFDAALFEDFFQDEAWQAKLAKIFQMKVDGFIVNYIKQYMLQDMIAYIYQQVGYAYEPAAR